MASWLDVEHHPECCDHLSQLRAGPRRGDHLLSYELLKVDAAEQCHCFTPAERLHNLALLLGARGVCNCSAGGLSLSGLARLLVGGRGLFAGGLFGFGFGWWHRGRASKRWLLTLCGCLCPPL